MRRGQRATPRGLPAPTEVRIGLILPPLYARMLTAAELTFAVEMALSEGEANAKLLAMLEATIETKVTSKVAG